MRVILLIIAFLFGLTGFSQITIYGTIKNGEGKPLVGASIYEPHQEIGVPSLTDGIYEIELKKKDIQLQISFVGYQSKILKISKSQLKINQKIDVILIRKVKTFDPIEVSSSPVKKVIDQDNLLIKDFAFYGDSLVLLLKSPENGYFLEIKDESAENGVRFNLNFRPKYIEYDCFGNLQLIAKDSVFQFALVENEIHLIDQFSIKTYEDLIKPCATENSKYFVFESLGAHGQSINYTFFPKDSNEEKTQIKILDLVGFKVAAQYYIEIIAIYNSVVSYGDNIIAGGIWNGDMKYLNETPLLNQMITFYDKILALPIYSPIFNQQNQFILFDHTNGFIEYPFSEKIKVKINYQESRNWIEIISYDKWTNEFVTYFKKNGIYSAHYINTGTGKLKNGIILEENAYPENLKIKNGFIYYLHKDFDDFYGNVLLKQKIKIENQH